MKGFLLKDWYLMIHYLRTYLFIAAIFLAASLFSKENLFLIIYPSLFCGIIPLTLLGYDEKSNWLPYSQMLPSTRAQYVSAKYLTGLIPHLLILLVTGLAHGIRMALTTGFEAGPLVRMLILVFSMTLLAPSICLPPAIKLGVEKGRLTYYLMIGVICGCGVATTQLLRGEELPQVPVAQMAPLLPLAALLLYALSWYLSIRAYQKREF